MDWISNVIVNTLNIVMIYYIYCGLTDTKPVFTRIRIEIGILWGILFGTCVEELGHDMYQLSMLFGMFIVIHLLYRKRIYNTFIIILLEYAIFIPFQLIAMLPLSPVPIYENVKFVISSILALLASVFLYYKIPINRILKSIETEVLVRCGFYLINLIIYVCIFYYRIGYGSLSPESLIFLLSIFISMFGFIITVTKIFYYTNQLPCISHDMKNALAGIYISANNTDDVKRIREDIHAYFKTLGINTPEKEDNIIAEVSNQKILTFIQYKMKERADMKKIVFDSDINYYEPYQQVPDATITIMLAILLDNAIDATPSGKKIKILIHVTEELLMLEVSNAHTYKSTKELMRIFENGYSTKRYNRRGHGYGLSNLHKIVQKSGGEIFAENMYDEVENAMYLTIRIVYKNDYSNTNSVSS